MFEETPTEQILLYALLGLFIQFLIIYWAVLAGTSDQKKILRIQTKLLEDLARKAGVPEEEIKASYAVNDTQKAGG